MADGIEERAQQHFLELQEKICSVLEREDGEARFSRDRWTRADGGGGLTRVLVEGAVFEKAGVNTSAVYGKLRPDFAAQLPGPKEDLSFFATGVSLVLHPRNPYVPTVHANFRCLSRGDARDGVRWFGGGIDLTPYYPEREDVVHFHRTLKTACDRHDPAHYPRFKKWCDDYFFLPHRGETRGVGGIFFDQLNGDAERDFAFVCDVGEAFLPAYLPIVKRRRETLFGDRERRFQLHRRGRYVEFNLLYDRGTLFGLKTDGRVESILMSLPPLVRWDYDPAFPPDSVEAALATLWLKPQEWI
jgi:coproporphyrinogen III oxidase